MALDSLPWQTVPQGAVSTLTALKLCAGGVHRGQSARGHPGGLECRLPRSGVGEPLRQATPPRGPPAQPLHRQHPGAGGSAHRAGRQALRGHQQVSLRGLPCVKAAACMRPFRCLQPRAGSGAHRAGRQALGGHQQVRLHGLSCVIVALPSPASRSWAQCSLSWASGPQRPPAGALLLWVLQHTRSHSIACKQELGAHSTGPRVLCTIVDSMLWALRMQPPDLGLWVPGPATPLLAS